MGVAVLGIDGDADAGAGNGLEAVDDQRAEQGRLDARHELHQVGMIAVDLHGAKFVAADAGYELAVVKQVIQALAEDLQGSVAGVVSTQIVDFLEPVQVDSEYADLATGICSVGELPDNLVVEADPVRQTGQRIVQGEVPKALNGLQVGVGIDELAGDAGCDDDQADAGNGDGHGVERGLIEQGAAGLHRNDGEGGHAGKVQADNGGDEKRQANMVAMPCWFVQKHVKCGGCQGHSKHQ